ncbi:2-hydroxyacid dehydrogenase [Amycolatopsis sp. BJA-103]|uniref:2-hydroxyacid dehydrogenase n=1 Tax=Amycolatopsis sp. BJA-103 TaxID=1911175 RepID=UPI000C78AE64|nr:2-hydroxyacid dehydrogenase [Amycolatopsis sp. BJA-103]AUI60716.1 dihydrofolate reductase [Amycolatopsis sp. BJA-103]PNE21997.1 dihydrofolate reductase [Amycolatopsis sp. BJA-103]
MTERAILPWADIELPEGLGVRLYDGIGPLPEGGLDDVEVYVLPYDTGAEPTKLIDRLPSLKLVQSLSAGVEGLVPLVPAGVKLANGRGLHDLSVAEHALALIHASQRDLPRWFAQQATGSWAREHTRSLADSRVLLVGHGSIGQAIERQLIAAEAVVTRVASTARPAERVHGVGELAALLPSADIVVLILPETPATTGLFGAAELAALPDGALVVNVGRGSAIDTAALTAETVTGRLRAALDVVDPEPLPAGHPLWTAPGVVITPHIAGGSASFYPRAKRLVAEQLRRYVAGEEPLNVVG